ncbi:MAG: ABC transporter ATP-binding protein [SAR324 cluster bacterium]|nr:ABC transporter ATP-binding protein [SAR324 cluster bacterium]
MTVLLEVKNLEAQYGLTKVLHGVDFTVEDGGITTILGANGAGKTTTLRAICGMVQTAGSITFAGERIEGKATEDIVRRGIAHVPDGRGTFVNLTTEENLRLGSFTRKDKAAVIQDFERVYRYFPVLLQRRGQQAGTLSGGEQQMLAIARALVGNPKLLLLDEPSEGIQPNIVHEMEQKIAAINKRHKISMILVEQNIEFAAALAQRVYVMDKGLIATEISPDKIMDETIVRNFLAV